jgi:hypothetical protein
LGVVAYELLTGRMPFVGTNTPAILHQVLNRPAPPFASVAPALHLPAGVEMVVLRQLDKLPGNRNDSAGAFVRAIEEAAARADEARFERETESMPTQVPAPRPAPPRPSPSSPSPPKPGPPLQVRQSTPPLRHDARRLTSVMRLLGLVDGLLAAVLLGVVVGFYPYEIPEVFSSLRSFVAPRWLPLMTLCAVGYLAYGAVVLLTGWRRAALARTAGGGVVRLWLVDGLVAAAVALAAYVLYWLVAGRGNEIASLGIVDVEVFVLVIVGLMLAPALGRMLLVRAARSTRVACRRRCCRRTT